ncbi:hypothetical protein F443_04627 [Phytophthora nicotianae P1569]|uniref:Uncharacterized protein n=1 Tax=Phytophthora nicotianae P1569 TaxID=1317065 RepID=V9FN01_PHYNI|nr:hypothetical protein F443_04627 [Phytophthora nicotianae P1569]
MAKKRSATAKPERIADSDLSRLDTPWCRGTSWPQPAGVHARRADTSPVEFGADARAGISWRWSEVSLQSSVFCSAALALSNNYVHSRCLCRTSLPPSCEDLPDPERRPRSHVTFAPTPSLHWHCCFKALGGDRLALTASHRLRVGA